MLALASWSTLYTVTLGVRFAPFTFSEKQQYGVRLFKFIVYSWGNDLSVKGLRCGISKERSDFCCLGMENSITLDLECFFKWCGYCIYEMIETTVRTNQLLCWRSQVLLYRLPQLGYLLNDNIPAVLAKIFRSLVLMIVSWPLLAVWR